MSSHNRQHFEPMGLPVLASKRAFDFKRVNWLELVELRKRIVQQAEDAAILVHQAMTTPKPRY